MSVPDEYYIVMPQGAFDHIKKLLKGKTGNSITPSIQENIDAYLVEHGEWTDQNIITKSGLDWRYWTIGGVDHVIVEKDS
jgi:hypothetical protein